MSLHINIKQSRSFVTGIIALLMVSALFAGIFAILPQASASTIPTVTRYVLDDDTGQPSNAVAASDGNVWFTVNSLTALIANVSPEGIIAEVPHVDYFEHQPTVVGIAEGHDNSVWVAAFDTISPASALVKTTFYGVSTVYPLPDPNARPYGITAGPDGNMWYVTSSDKVGKMDAFGAVTEYSLPTTGATPYNITTGPDGNLWLTYFGASGNKVAKVTTSGVITEYNLPAGSRPFGIISGPDNSLWVGAWGNDKILKISTSGVVTTYDLWSGANPRGLTVGADGNIWFVGDTVEFGYLDVTTGEATQYDEDLFPNGAGLYGIALGSDDNIWMTEGFGDSVDKFSLEEYVPPVPGDPDYTGLTPLQPFTDSNTLDKPWKDIDSDTSGDTVIVGDEDGNLVITINGGEEWNAVTDDPDMIGTSWYGVGVSGDGSTMIAGQTAGDIYVSYDKGETWVNTTADTALSGLPWFSVDINDDGSLMTAVSIAGIAVVSDDGGQTWQNVSDGSALNEQPLSAVAMNDDGTVLLVGAYSGSLFLSFDFGQTWVDAVNTLSILPEYQGWEGIAITPNGDTIVVVASYGSIFVSTNRGVSWTNTTAQTLLDGLGWKKVSISNDGEKIVAAAGGDLGKIFVSLDLGDTWINLTDGTDLDVELWSAVIISGNGESVYATVPGGDIYKATQIPVAEDNDDPDTTPDPELPAPVKPTGSTGRDNSGAPPVTPRPSTTNSDTVAVDDSETGNDTAAPSDEIGTNIQPNPTRNENASSSTPFRLNTPLIVGGIIALAGLITAVVFIVRRLR